MSEEVLVIDRRLKANGGGQRNERLNRWLDTQIPRKYRIAFLASLARDLYGDPETDIREIRKAA